MSTSFCQPTGLGKILYKGCIYGNQKWLCVSWFSLSTTWVLKTKLMLSCLTTRTITCWAILPALKYSFFGAFWYILLKLKLNKNLCYHSLNIFKLIFMCIGVLSVCMSLHHICAVPMKAKRGLQLTWAWNYWGWEKPCGCVEVNPDLLQGQPVLLTIKPSLQTWLRVLNTNNGGSLEVKLWL